MKGTKEITVFLKYTTFLAINKTIFLGSSFLYYEVYKNHFIQNILVAKSCSRLKKKIIEIRNSRIINPK